MYFILQDAFQLELPPLPAFPGLHTQQQPAASHTQPGYGSAARSQQAPGQGPHAGQTYSPEAPGRQSSSATITGLSDSPSLVAPSINHNRPALSNPPPHPAMHPPRNPTPMSARMPMSPPRAAAAEAPGLAHLWNEDPGWDLRRNPRQTPELQQFAEGMGRMQRGPVSADHLPSQIPSALEEALSQAAARFSAEFAPVDSLQSQSAAPPHEADDSQRGIRHRPGRQHNQMQLVDEGFTHSTVLEGKEAPSDFRSGMHGSMPHNLVPEPYAHTARPAWRTTDDGAQESLPASCPLTSASKDQASWIRDAGQAKGGSRSVPTFVDRHALGAQSADPISQSIPAWMDRHVLEAQAAEPMSHSWPACEDRHAIGAQSAEIMSHAMPAWEDGHVFGAERGEPSSPRQASIEAMQLSMRTQAYLEEALIQSARETCSGSLRPPWDVDAATSRPDCESSSPMLQNCTHNAHSMADQHRHHRASTPFPPLFCPDGTNAAGQQLETPMPLQQRLDHDMPLEKQMDHDMAAQQPCYDACAAFEEDPGVMLPRRATPVTHEPIPYETGLQDSEASMHRGIITSGMGPRGRARSIRRPASVPPQQHRDCIPPHDRRPPDEQLPGANCSPADGGAVSGEHLHGTRDDRPAADASSRAGTPHVNTPQDL